MVAFTYIAVAAATVAEILAAPGAWPPSPLEHLPDFEIGPHNLARRQDYNQNYRTGGNVNFQPSSNGYSVTFSGAGDFVVGKGWKTGTARNISFSGSTTYSSGTVLVSVYGWTRNPLVEYYVQEYTSNGKGSAQGQKLGSLESDGSTYEIWKHQQVGQPSIAGTTNFWQYISNRVEKRPGSGTVTMANHFEAWKKAGLNLGTHDYQVLATEGWGNAGGNSKYTLSAAGAESPPTPPKQSSSSSRPPPPPSSSAPSSKPTTSSTTSVASSSTTPAAKPSSSTSAAASPSTTAATAAPPASSTSSAAASSTTKT